MNSEKKRPNIVFIFADEWRAQATGYNGDSNCETPRIDAMAAHSINLTQAVSGQPICCPYRASLITGQYPLTHGVFTNDVELDPQCTSIADAYKKGGYDTAYIGKWHLYGSPDGWYGRRHARVPRSHQMRFDLWKGFECNHNYNDSWYYYNDDPEPRKWEGYDAFAQSESAASYIREHAKNSTPFFLMLSWGPPHFPLDSAPEEYQKRYANREIELRPNVPEHLRDQAREELRGYYAHIAAIDDALGIVQKAISKSGIENDTILVLTSDHGDMRQSQGFGTKFVPWDESVRVPFLLRWPELRGGHSAELPIPIDAPDIMPTLLGLCDLEIPHTVEGRDWSSVIRGVEQLSGNEAALLYNPVESCDLCKYDMRAYRGIRSERYCYLRNTDGPWLLYDLAKDPYQMNNLIDSEEYTSVKNALDTELHERLAALGDEFLDSWTYIERACLTHYKEVNCRN